MQGDHSLRDNMRVSFALFLWEAVPIVVCAVIGTLVADFAGLVIGLVVGGVLGTIGLVVALFRAAARDRRAGVVPGGSPTPAP